MKLEVSTLRSLLGITTMDKDTVLQFVLDDVEETILNYCNLDTIPKGLVKTAYRMATDLYRSEGFGQEAIESGVSSISEGGATVSFKSSNYDTSFTSSLLKNYERQLMEYRRLKW